MVRQKVSARPNATGKSLSLFDGMEEVNGYRYACYITDLSLPAAQVWRLYRGRANAENRIKELKYDYGLDKINQESFEGTEATLNFLMVAFNIMNLFKNQVIDEKIKKNIYQKVKDFGPSNTINKLNRSQDNFPQRPSNRYYHYHYPITKCNFHIGVINKKLPQKAVLS